jgi:hypothetical protein
LQQQSAPIFQRMTALTDQRAQLDQMNPIVRSVFGFFNRDYNPDYIDSQVNDAKGELASRAAEFQTNLTAHDAVLSATKEQFNDALNVWEAKKSGLDTEQQIHSNIAATASDAAKIAIQGLNAGVEVINAQRTARADLLDQMSQSDVNKNLALAQRNGGQVVVNGIPLSVGELKQTSMGWDQKNLSLANMRLSNASQNLALKSANESWHISHLGRAETQAAIQNGGRLPDGTQVDVGKLTNHIQDILTGDQAIDLQAKQGNIIGQYQQGVMTLGSQADSVLERARQLGGVPSELVAIHGRIRSLIQQQNSSFAGFKGEQGAKNALISSSLGDIQKQSLELSKYVDSAADKMSGGDKDKRAFYYGWMTGSQLDPGVAANAMIKFGMTHTFPTGMTTDPTTQQAIAKVQAAVDKYMGNGNSAGGPGNNVMAMLQKKKDISEGKIPADLQAQVADIVKGVQIDGHLTQVTKAVPAVAAQIKGPDGAPHPASRINAQDLEQAMHFGDAQAMDWLTKTLKVDDKQAAAILSAGKNSAEWMQWTQQHKQLGTLSAAGQKPVTNATLDDVSGMYNAIRTSAFYHGLDNSASAKPDFQPSKAFVDLWNRPEFQQMAVNFSLNKSNQSPMSYAMGALANPNIGAQTINYANRYSRTWSTQENAKNQQQLEWAARFRGLAPASSALFTASAVGLNDAQSKQLIQTAYPIAQQLAAQQAIPLDQAIDQVIQNHKFADPVLEKVRQQAARRWTEARDEHSKGFAAMVSGYNLMGGGGAQQAAAMESAITGEPAQLTHQR